MNRIFCIFLFFVPFLNFGQSNNYSILSIPQELLQGANSVVREERTTVNVIQSNKVVIKQFRAVTVLNKRGKSHSDPYVRYDNNQRVKKLEVFIYDALGNETEHFKKKDFKDLGITDEVSFYDDNRALILEYTPTSYPYTVVFSSEVQNNSSAFIPPWYPLKRYTMAVQKSTYELFYAPHNKPRVFRENLDGLDITYAEHPDKIIAEAKHLSAVPYQAYSPSFQKMVPKINFSLNEFHLAGVTGKAKNWEEFGLWMQESLLSDVAKLPESTISSIKNLVKNENTNIGKARKIYEYLQNKVRYISVQIGIGGWKPFPASEVDQLGYGDCKALTNYTKVLLDVVGVPSYYTILYAGDEERDILRSFSSLQGDHAILGIPENGEIIWLECTSQQTPFGFGGNFIDDRDVLMITPDGGKIAHTKKYSFKENLQSNTAIVEITNSGVLNADFQSVSNGLQYDDKYRLPNKSTKDRQRYYKNKWGYLNGISAENIQYENNKTAIVFTENMQISAPNYCEKFGEDFLFTLNVFNRFDAIPPRYAKKGHPLQIDEGFMDKDTLTINFPNGYVVESLPPKKVLKTEFGSYTFTFTKETNNTYRYTRRFSLEKGIFSAEMYEKFRGFLQKVAQLDQTKILLQKN